MLPSQSTRPDRREFLRGAARFAVLGGIAAALAAAVRRGAIAGPGCTRARFCDACTEFARCDKDQARAARQAEPSQRGAS